jgi:hypothetical protein
VRFGAVEHAAGDAYRHVQPFQVVRSTGAHALKGVEGDVIASSLTGASVTNEDGIRFLPGSPQIFSPAMRRRLGSLGSHWLKRNVSLWTHGRTAGIFSPTAMCDGNRA